MAIFAKILKLVPLQLECKVQWIFVYVVRQQNKLGAGREQNVAIKAWTLWHSNLDDAAPPMCYFDCVVVSRCLRRCFFYAYKNIYGSDETPMLHSRKLITSWPRNALSWGITMSFSEISFEKLSRLQIETQLFTSITHVIRITTGQPYRGTFRISNPDELLEHFYLLVLWGLMIICYNLQYFKREYEELKNK